MKQTVLLIGEDGKKIGHVSFEEAKRIAREQNKDLMLVNKEKRVYKIGDEGKLKYERKQKERRLRAKRRNQKIKEIQIRPTIGSNDLETKLRRVREFLNGGLKTKIIMRFKRQQMGYRDSGMRMVVDMVSKIVEEGIEEAEDDIQKGKNKDTDDAEKTKEDTKPQCLFSTSIINLDIALSTT